MQNLGTDSLLTTNSALLLFYTIWCMVYSKIWVCSIPYYPNKYWVVVTLVKAGRYICSSRVAVPITHPIITPSFCTSSYTLSIDIYVNIKISLQVQKPSSEATFTPQINIQTATNSPPHLKIRFLLP